MGWKAFARTFAVISAVIAIVLFFVFFPFHSLEYGEYGLDYDYIMETVDSTLYTSGWHWLGFGHQFIKYPAIVQTVEFSGTGGSSEGHYAVLASRTSDGLDVTLSVSFQYLLLPQELFALYNQYETNYVPVFVRTAQHYLTETATNFTAFGFFADRTSIGVQMQQILAQAFLTSMHSRVDFFQLKEIGLPKGFEDAIQAAEVARQDIQKATFEQQNVRVQAATRVLQAAVDANITIVNAKAAASSQLVQALATANATANTINIETQAYANVVQSLGLTPDGLNQYLYTLALQQHDKANFLVGVANAIVDQRAGDH